MYTAVNLKKKDPPIKNQRRTTVSVSVNDTPAVVDGIRQLLAQHLKLGVWRQVELLPGRTENIVPAGKGQTKRNSFRS